MQNRVVLSPLLQTNYFILCHEFHMTHILKDTHTLIQDLDIPPHKHTICACNDFPSLV